MLLSVLLSICICCQSEAHTRVCGCRVEQKEQNFPDCPSAEERPAPIKWTSQCAAMAAVVVGRKAGFGLAHPL